MCVKFQGEANSVRTRIFGSNERIIEVLFQVLGTSKVSTPEENGQVGIEGEQVEHVDFN